MFEGKEVEGKIGDVGSYSVDVDDKGICAVAVTVKKEVEGAMISNELKAEISIFLLLEKVAAKTAAKWDDVVVSELEKLLGIKKA